MLHGARARPPATVAARRPAWMAGYRAACRVALSAMLFATLLFNGSVAPPYVQASHLGLALLLVLCLPVPVASRRRRLALRWTALALALAAVWGLLQSLLAVPAWLAHPVWQEVGPLLPTSASYISVAPARSLDALPNLLMPGLVFAAVLCLAQSRHAAARMWTLLALVGLAIAGISLALELFFPKVRFFSGFEVGWGGFSGVFVNRNTTASFLVLTAFALIGAVMLSRAERAAQLRTRKQAGATLWSMTAVLYAAALGAVVVAVIVTGSRAGTLMGLPVLVLTLAAIQLFDTDRGRQGGRSRFSPWQRAVLVILAGIGVLLAFGGRVLSRLGSDVDDGRLCAWQATARAILDRPWTGTGFGTFVDMFPAYRDPECLGTQGTWVRAHNSFLELALGFGIPATALLLAAGYGLILWLCLHGARHRRSLKAIPLLTLGALTFASLHSLVDFPLQIPGVAAYFAALMGAGCAISCLETPPRETKGRHRRGGMPNSAEMADRSQGRRRQEGRGEAPGQHTASP